VVLLTRFCAEEPHEYSYKYRTSSLTVDHHQVIQLILNQFYSAVQLHFQHDYINNHYIKLHVILYYGVKW
jgi:hypothetical protein